MAKIIPIGRKQSTKDKLVATVGELLARDGFGALGVNKVAREAGVDRSVIYRYFGGLPELVAAYARSVDFWPTVDELLGGEPDVLDGLTPGEQMAFFFKSYLAALLRRPLTLEILAWETLERNELTELLEDVRVRTALEFFEHLGEDVPDHLDLTAVVVLMAVAVNHMAIRSRTNGSLGGVDLTSMEGWHRIENALDLLLSSLDHAPAPPPAAPETES